MVAPPKIKYLGNTHIIICEYLPTPSCNEGFLISLFHLRWWIYDISIPREFTPRYYDATLDSHDQDLSAFRDKGKNRYLEAVARLDDLHIKLPRQQFNQLVNQLTAFQVNVASSHAAFHKNL